jgi:hypothetical protein
VQCGASLSRKGKHAEVRQSRCGLASLDMEIDRRSAAKEGALIPDANTANSERFMIGLVPTFVAAAQSTS